MKTFGNYVKELRIEKEITLREFCRLANLDPSNWSKIEREVMDPPKSKITLENICEALNVKADSEEYKNIFDLAVISTIPKDLIGNEKVLEQLPIFFRTARGERPTESELRELINLIKGSNEKNPT